MFVSTFHNKASQNVLKWPKIGVFGHFHIHLRLYMVCSQLLRCFILSFSIVETTNLRFCREHKFDFVNVCVYISGVGSFTTFVPVPKMTFCDQKCTFYEIYVGRRTLKPCGNDSAPQNQSIQAFGWIFKIPKFFGFFHVYYPC